MRIFCAGACGCAGVYLLGGYKVMIAAVLLLTAIKLVVDQLVEDTNA